MILWSILLALALALDPLPNTEPREPMFATRYRKGLMQEVAKTRGIEMTWCGMAIDNQPPGSFVMVQGVRTGVRRLCRVVDWSKPRDKARHVRDRLIELDHENQALICGRDVAMSGWKSCPVLIYRLP